ncbi:hypothetical protein [Streptomyces sp. NBC_00102]|uniref:hypothetical protein n=1 Tax=Streptomyces sp. NBC_00102 TaxID=2975652 RepID=UPI0022561720|nr:hypothetical protein [Streptomyces sp. NBC_00102]MCX5396869.1 hypothetical protein [Streptomyces sp. NBC_00102]
MSVPEVRTSDEQGPRGPIPALGALMVDTRYENLVGEFRGVVGAYWAIRPVCGGNEWKAAPAFVRPASPMERLRAENARCNARSRGDLL